MANETYKGIEVSGIVYDNEDETARSGVSGNATSIGTLSSLETEAKTNLVSALNEVNAKENVITIGSIYQAPGSTRFVKLDFTFLYSKMELNQGLQFVLYGGKGSTVFVSIVKTSGTAIIEVSRTIGNTASQSFTYSIDNGAILYVPYTATGVYATLLCLSDLPKEATNEDVTLSLASALSGTETTLPAIPTSLVPLGVETQYSANTDVTVNIPFGYTYLLSIIQGYPNYSLLIPLSAHTAPASFQIVNPITGQVVANGESFSFASTTITVQNNNLVIRSTTAGRYVLTRVA